VPLGCVFAHFRGVSRNALYEGMMLTYLLTIILSFEFFGGEGGWVQMTPKSKKFENAFQNTLRKNMDSNSVAECGESSSLGSYQITSFW